MKFQQKKKRNRMTVYNVAVIFIKDEKQLSSSESSKRREGEKIPTSKKSIIYMHVCRLSLTRFPIQQRLFVLTGTNTQTHAHTFATQYATKREAPYASYQNSNFELSSRASEVSEWMNEEMERTKLPMIS